MIYLVVGVAATVSAFSFLIAAGMANQVQQLRREVDMLLSVERNRAEIVAEAVQKILRERDSAFQ